MRKPCRKIDPDGLEVCKHSPGQKVRDRIRLRSVFTQPFEGAVKPLEAARSLASGTFPTYYLLKQNLQYSKGITIQKELSLFFFF